MDLSNRSEVQKVKEEKVQGFLGKQMRVTIADGRVFDGRFHCFDNMSNIILTDTFQIIDTDNIRRLGQVLITGKHVKNCEVDVSPPLEQPPEPEL